MPTLQLQVSIGGDSAFARDFVQNVLYFDVDTFEPATGYDPGQLCADLIDAYQAGWLNATAREIRCKAYNMDEPAPRAPVATKVENAGSYPTSSQPRETALCLSFRGDPPYTPSRRGRIFLPLFVSSFTAGTPRPNSAIQTAALGMSDRLAGLGGLNVDWVIHSKTRGNTAVKHAWVDDEWDVQRRRGLRPTARTEKDVGP